MNKDDFLKILSDSLSSFPEEEKRDILYDYEEHFRIGFENGKSEEELIQELGNPEDISAQYKCSNDSHTQEKIFSEEVPLKASSADYTLNEGRSAASSVIAALALGFFNIVFIIWIFISIGAVLLSLGVAAIAVAFSGLALCFAPAFVYVLPSAVSFPANFPFELSFLFGIGTAALGALFIIGVFYLMKFFCIAIAKYTKWNISIIKGR